MARLNTPPEPHAAPTMSLGSHAQIFAPPEAADGRRRLVGLDRPTLEAELEAAGYRRFRARQLWHWLYHQGARDFEAMTTLGKAARADLGARYVIERPAIRRRQDSADGTIKWLLRFADGQEVETVFIPEPGRGTLCVSSQVGCTLTCRFCHTGTQGLVRNLGPAEILGQLMVARDELGDWPSGRADRRLTNIVMMGMGEPLYNWDNVATALEIMLDGDGIALSRRRITLSSSGVVPKIAECGARLGVNLAISLHAVTDELRDELVPLNRKYPLAALLEACRRYPGADNNRRITFEYVMLKEVNDSDAEARELVRHLEGIPAKVNLIPFNPWPGAPYECSTPERIRAFAEILLAAGYPSPTRRPRGQDIDAACGQLKSASRRARRPRRAAETTGTTGTAGEARDAGEAGARAGE